MITCASKMHCELLYRLQKSEKEGTKGEAWSVIILRILGTCFCVGRIISFLIIFILFRYGQKKPCFVYRLVMDNCLEKKIYDRQINKQGMADRVVDECNPDAHLSIKEVTNLCWDNEQDSEPRDFIAEKDKYIDVVMQKLLEKFGTRLSKVCLLLHIITNITCFWCT